MRFRRLAAFLICFFTFFAFCTSDPPAATAGHEATQADENWRTTFHQPGLGGVGAFAALEFRGHLIVGGNILSAGSQPVHGVARWDGAQWRPLAQGVGVQAMATYEGDLIVGGTFASLDGFPANGVARWNGTTWSPMSSGFYYTHEYEVIHGSVFSLSVIGGILFATGKFESASGQSARSVAWWSGEAWVPLEPAKPCYAPPDYIAIWDLMLYEGSLIAGLTHPCYKNRLARWNGTKWETLAKFRGPAVHVISTYDSRLLIAGRFDVIGGVRASGVSVWDGSSWNALGKTGGDLDGRVTSLIRYQDKLVASGSFFYAGSAPANKIAAWDGQRWEPLGSGLDDFAYAMVQHGNDLIVGGRLATAGGVAVHGIARWDGQAWNAMGGGLAPRVNALAVYRGEVIAGGKFSRDGGIPIKFLAAFDGVAWRQIDLDVPLAPVVEVRALLVFQDELIVSLVNSPGIPGHVVRWNGQRWRLMGPFNRVVRVFVEWNGDLYAGGDFDEPTDHLARWNGTTWEPLGTTFGGGVRALAVYDDRLFVGGQFSSLGQVLSNSLAQYDGATWSTVGSGLRSLDGGL